MKFPVEELVLVGLLLTKQRRQNRNAVQPRGWFDSGDFRGGGQKIPEGPDLLAHRARFNLARPADDHWHPDAALVHVALDAAQRPGAVEKRGFDPAFIMRAVVTGEEH